MKLSAHLARLLSSALLVSCSGKPADDVPPNGRYVIAHIPHAQGQAILLDTATGETWSQVSTGPTRDDVTEWLPMDKTTLREWIDLNHPERVPRPKLDE